MQCPYCNNNAPVPGVLLQAKQEADASKTASRLGRYLVIFLVLVVVVPTCLSIAVTLLGAFLGIVGPLLGIILPFALSQ